MRRHPTTTCVLVSFLALLVFATTARASDDSVAVLGIDSLEVGDAIGNQLTEALRRRAAETNGIRVVPGKDLVELKMVFGCDGEAPACLAQAGRSLGADRLIYGSLKKADGGRNVVVSMKLLDVRELVVIRQINETVPKRAFTTNLIPTMAGRWFGQLIVLPQLGAIAVQSQPVDAQVSVDGAPAGRTPLKVKDVRPGQHTVAVQLDGFAPSTQTVDVHAGSTETVMTRLVRQRSAEPLRAPTVGVVTPLTESNPLVEEPPKPRHPGRGAKIAAIGLVAGAVVSGAVAIYTWRTYLNLETTTQNELTAIAPKASSDPATVKYYASPSCGAPPSSVGNAAAIKGYMSDCDSGHTYANATIGLWATAGVLATAGLVSFVVGDRLDAKAERERREGRASAPSIRQSLRLLPAISTQGGGLQASFEF